MKRHKLPAVVWTDRRVNASMVDEVADKWDLPRAAVEEALCYGETHQGSLRMETEEGKLHLAETSIGVAPNREGQPPIKSESRIGYFNARLFTRIVTGPP